jgi:hypothetical protein
VNKNRSDIIPKQGSGASVDYPAALSAIAPYPAFCGVVAPAVSAARYCKCPSCLPEHLFLPLPTDFFCTKVYLFSQGSAEKRVHSCR